MKNNVYILNLYHKMKASWGTDNGVFKPWSSCCLVVHKVEWEVVRATIALLASSITTTWDAKLLQHSVSGTNTCYGVNTEWKTFQRLSIGFEYLIDEKNSLWVLIYYVIWLGVVWNFGSFFPEYTHMAGAQKFWIFLLL